MASIALTALLLLSAKAELLLSNDFEGGKVVGWRLRGDVAKLTSDPKEVISGKFSLKASTVGKRGLYFEFAHLDQGTFKLKTPATYRLEFEFKIVKLTKDGRFYWGVRGGRGLGQEIIGPDGKVYKNTWWCIPFPLPTEARYVRLERGKVKATFSLSPRAKYQILLGLRFGGNEVILDNIRLYRVFPPRKPPEAPKLFVPFPNQTLTDVAVQFYWFNDEASVDYELQISRDEGFSKPKVIMVAELSDYEFTTYLPKDDELLEEGRWFWRVRGINEYGDKGPWSEKRSFFVEGGGSKSKLVREISPRRPLFVFADGFGDKAVHLAAKWLIIPEELRPLSAIRVAYSAKDFYQVCEEMKRRGFGVPLIVQFFAACGAPKPARKEIPLPLLEHAFRNYPWVLGVCTAELWGRHDRARRLHERATALCSKYGRIFLFIQCNSIESYQFLAWGAKEGGEGWWRFINRYKENFVPVCKFVGPSASLTLHQTVLGWWLCGAVRHHGMQAEPFYWRGMGGKPELGCPPSEEPLVSGEWWRRCPPEFLSQILLIGLCGGAEVYALEPWLECVRCYERLRATVFPLLEAIAREGLVPSKEEVLKEVRLGYHAEAEDIDRISFKDLGKLKNLVLGVYGLDPSFFAFDVVPKRFDFFFVPIFPELCPKERIPESIRLIPSEEFKGRKLEEFERFLRPYARKFEEGKAFVCKVGRILVVMNSKENERERQRFRIRLEGPILEAWGEVGLHSYLVAKIGGEKAFLHFGGRREERTKLSLRCRRKPSIRAEPLEGLRNVKWEEGVLSVEVDHSRGAVEVWLEFGE